MIVVIADDFTGASEIAGIAFRYNLSSSITIDEELLRNTPKVIEGNTDIQVFIIAMNTRGKEPEESYSEVLTIAKFVEKLRSEWIYKKTDSLLRGNIYSELKAMIDCGRGFTSVLLVPANPSMGRVISGGIYMIDGQEIHKTQFADDPEYPLTSSYVMDILKVRDRSNVFIRSAGQGVMGYGITIGEAMFFKDLEEWAREVNRYEGVLPAGGSDFFRALLEIKGYKSQRRADLEEIYSVYHGPYLGGRNLLICGSAFSSTFKKYGDIINHFDKIGHLKVSTMPEEVFYKTDRYEFGLWKWIEEIIDAFEDRNCVIINIGDRAVIRDKSFAKRLAHDIARVVSSVLKEVKINNLFIEGGSTAYEILKRAGFYRFIPELEITPGIVKLRISGVEDMSLTVKPGSYLWPEFLIRELFCKTKG